MRKLIGTIVVLLVLVAGVGYYRGWFSISKTKGPGTDDVRVGVSIDKSKARGDVAQAGEKLRELTQSGPQEREPAAETAEHQPAAPEKASESGERASGKIVGLDPAGSVTIETNDGQKLQIEVPNAASVMVDGREAGAAALRSGDQVVVQYRSSEGKNVANELSVTTQPS